MMTIYNLFPLLAGRFVDWPDHLRRAADLGFGWVLVNPIQFPGSGGGLYSISDYFRWHPRLVDVGLPEDPFLQSRAAIECGEGLGLSFMVDLVLGFCAADSALVVEHPEWFVWEGGEVGHPDVAGGEGMAMFDYGDGECGEGLDGLLDFWVRLVGFLVEQGFRGFRCVGADGVPLGVWGRLLGRVREIYPDVVFVCGALGCSGEVAVGLAGVGFDYLLNSSKWWNFRDGWLLEEYGRTCLLADSIGFPEGHDTVRLAAELKGCVAGLKQRYLFTALFSGGVLMPMGFEFGFVRGLDVVGSRPGDWEETGVDLCGFVRGVNSAKGESLTFQSDVRTRFVESGCEGVCVMHKVDEGSGEESLVVLNVDCVGRRRFGCGSLYDFLFSRRRLVDVSPEGRLDFLPSPFEYDLEPGQGLVLVTRG